MNPLIYLSLTHQFSFSHLIYWMIWTLAFAMSWIWLMGDQENGTHCLMFRHLIVHILHYPHNSYLKQSCVEWLRRIKSCPCQNPHDEVLISNVVVFGDGLYKEVIKLKWGHRAGSRSNRISVLIGKDAWELIPSLYAHKKAMWAHSKVVTTSKLRTEALERNPPWISSLPNLDFPAWRLWERNFFCLSTVCVVLFWRC
jgi:hypothetical protein